MRKHCLGRQDAVPRRNGRHDDVMFVKAGVVTRRFERVARLPPDDGSPHGIERFKEVKKELVFGGPRNRMMQVVVPGLVGAPILGFLAALGA